MSLLVDMVRLSRVTLLIAEPGSQKSNLIQSTVMPLLSNTAASGKAEVAILFDAWDKAPLPALHARIQEALGPLGAAAGSKPTPDSGSLVANLRAWQEALGVPFFIIFDRFEEYLRMPPGRVGVTELEQELVEAINDPTLRANFLLSLDEEAEPLARRLRDHIPRLGYSRVRLPRASDPIPIQRREPAASAPDVFSASSLRIESIASTANLSETKTRVDEVTQAEATTKALAAAGQTLEPPKAAEAQTLESPPAAGAGAVSPPPTVTAARALAPKRRLARLAWVPIALAGVAVYLFLQPAPRPTAERAQRVAESASTAPRSETAPEPGQNASTPVQSSKNEPEVAADTQPTAPALAAEPRASVVEPTLQSAQSAQQPKVAVPQATAAPIQPPRQAEPAPPKTAPAIPIQPGRQAQGAAPTRSAAALTQSTRQPESASKVSSSAPVPSASTEAPAGPRLYIHVRNEAQRASAEQMIRPLGERGIRVAGVKVVPSGPDELAIRYFHQAQRDEALKVAVALRDFGFRAQHLQHAEDAETPATSRQYELWLPSTGYDQRP